jgi:signal transduction histidine kinase
VKRYLRRAEVLLDVSRITAGRLRLELGHCDLTAMLHEVVEEFQPVAKRANVPITLQAPDALTGTWDCLALEQILDNLVSNAFKHGDRTPIEVTAEVVGERVRIKVRDHGRGILGVDRERVFERFEQAVRPGEQRTGFGIGLWLVRELAVAMGGTILMEDAPSGGALFTVTLPRHMAQAAA